VRNTLRSQTTTSSATEPFNNASGCRSADCRVEPRKIPFKPVTKAPSKAAPVMDRSR
jgi:hypothetical protein